MASRSVSAGRALWLSVIGLGLVLVPAVPAPAQPPNDDFAAHGPGARIPPAPSPPA